MVTVSQISHGGTIGGQAPPVSVRPSLSVIIEDEAGGNFRARLVAADDAPAGALAGLPAVLRQNGFPDHFADVWQGKHILVVTELTKDTQSKLLHLLQEVNLLQPDAISYNVRSDAELLKENFRRDALKWAGRFALSADMMMIAAGLAQPRKDWYRIANGVGFAGSQLLMAIHGNGQEEIDFDKLFRDMNTHFKRNGMDLPMIAEPEQRKNFLGKLNDYLKANTVNLVFGLGAVSNLGNIRSGITEYQRYGSGISRALYGTGSAATSAAVVMLPERKKKRADSEDMPDQAHDASYYLSHPLQAPAALVDFIIASPLRFKGIYSTFNSALHLTDAREEFNKIKKWKENKGGLHGNQTYVQKDMRFKEIMDMPKQMRQQSEIVKEASELATGMEELTLREAFAHSRAGKITPYLTMAIGVGYLLGSIFVSFSSRHRDRSFEEADEYEKMYALASQSLLPFPPEQREAMLQQMGTYLSTQKDVKDGAIGIEKISSEVSQRLEKLDQSPWLSPVNPAPVQPVIAR